MHAAVVLAFVGILVPGSSMTAAPAEPSCAESVVADWSEDGLIQGTYEIACYRDAMHILPEDVLIYSSALDDISRELREALAAQESAAGAGASKADAPRRLTGRRQAQAAEDGAQPAAEATPALVPDESSASRSPPLPVLLMTALTLVLVLAGSAGLLGRRIRQRRDRA